MGLLRVFPPLFNGGTHDFIVDWGDSSASSYINAWDDAGKSYTHASAGTYTVTITGTMGGWSFDSIKAMVRLTMKVITAQAKSLSAIGGRLVLQMQRLNSMVLQI